MKADYNNAISVTRDIYWVGFYDEEASLHCNPYLLIDGDEAVLIDPGSIPHFAIVMRKVMDLLNPEQISVIIAQHQDPDVCGNLAVLEDVIDRRSLKIAAHTNAIRLIRHLGVRSDFYAVEDHDYRLTLRSGRLLEFLFTPYLHSPGAIMTYDAKTKSLFSSDVFAAMAKDWELFASGDFFSAMDAFHQRYMPSNEILRRGLQQLWNYRIDRILPQHGSIIEGDDVSKAIEYLQALPCGIDLL